MNLNTLGRQGRAIVGVAAALAIVAVAALSGLAAPARDASAQETTGLPPALADVVRTEVASLAGVTVEGVAIVRLEAVTWSDGCIGIYPPGVACTLALVDGYAVWAVGGGDGYRFHTNMSSSAQLAAAGFAPSTIAAAPLPEGATLRGDGQGTVISGEVPLAGGFGLIVFGGGSYTQLVQSSGCPIDSARYWFTSGGEFVILVPASAVGAVNAPFDALFGGSVPAQTALIGTCPARSGIEGTVTSGPITPVCQQGVPCEQPYQAMLLVTDSDGIEVARTTSNLNGTYRIGLLPGTYTVVPQPGGEIFPIASPVSVTVPGGEYVTLDVSYDTGIR